MISRLCSLLLLGVVTVTVITVPAIAAAPTDACQVLTVAQVSAAVGTTVEAGTHVTPTFTKTCTWTAKEIIVTLSIEGLQMFNGGKGTLASAERTSGAGVGDESYYMGVGGSAALHVKKGGDAFKVAIYSSKFSLDQRKAMEKTLAQQAASQF